MNRLFLTSLLLIAFAEGARGQEASIAMEEKDHGAYVLDGHFLAEVPVSIVWDVLTDYDHIADFVSSMEKSRVVKRTDGGFFVEQWAKGEFFLFSRSVYVLLNTQEKPYERISFEDTSHKDFGHYTGSWKLEETNEGVLVRYNLNAKNNFTVPGFIKRRVMRRSALELLEQVRSEILKRADKG